MYEENHGTVAVTGVTGALGRRIAARLTDRGVPQLLIGRSPDRIPQLPGAQRRGPAAYADASAMRTALEGALTLILISGHRTGPPAGGACDRGRGRDRGRRGPGPVCVPR